MIQKRKKQSKTTDKAISQYLLESTKIHACNICYDFKMSECSWISTPSKSVDELYHF